MMGKIKIPGFDDGPEPVRRRVAEHDGDREQDGEGHHQGGQHTHQIHGVEAAFPLWGGGGAAVSGNGSAVGPLHFQQFVAKNEVFDIWEFLG